MAKLATTQIDYVGFVTPGGKQQRMTCEVEFNDESEIVFTINKTKILIPVEELLEALKDVGVYLNEGV